MEWDDREGVYNIDISTNCVGISAPSFMSTGGQGSALDRLKRRRFVTTFRYIICRFVRAIGCHQIEHALSCHQWGYFFPNRQEISWGIWILKGLRCFVEKIGMPPSCSVRRMSSTLRFILTIVSVQHLFLMFVWSASNTVRSVSQCHWRWKSIVARLLGIFSRLYLSSWGVAAC